MNINNKKTNSKEINEQTNGLLNINSIQPIKLSYIINGNNNNSKSKSIKIEKNQQKNIQNLKYGEIQNMIKNTNKNILKKYSNELDKKIKYLKFMKSQKYSQDNCIYDNYTNNRNYVSESDKLKYQPCESTFDNSDNRNNIHTDFDNSNSKVIRLKNEKIYEEIIKKNIPNTVYHKHRNKNMCFKLNKHIDKTVKNSLETIISKGDINLNYKKFQSSFLIINDSISITSNTKIKNTNNSFLKLLTFLNNSEILNLFSTNREIRSCIIGCLAYKVKEKILPDFNLKYCKDLLFNNDYNFMILSKLYKKNNFHVRFILTIKPKITKLNKAIINKRIKIGFLEYINYKYNKKNKFENNQVKVNTSYQFEVLEKLNPKKFWVFRENTTFHYDENSKAYYNDTMQFWPGDKTLININLISEIGILDFDKFSWLEPKIMDIPIQNINNCEVEEIVSEWNKISLLENCETVKKNLDELFGKNFIIQEINYDDVGYYFFKIILKAYKIGVCSGREGNLGIKINIFPINYNITNEIKKNGLIFDENNELAVNVGDVITFYISQNKN